MCGHIGFLDSRKQLTVDEKEEFVKAGLYIDTLRGVDNTGMMLGTSDKYEITRSDQPGTSSAVQRWAKSKVFKGNSDIFMGHNRHGTIGGNIEANAHPFDTDTIVGAHNGTLHNSWRRLVDTQYGTDSESLYSMMSSKGFKETIETLSGAMALVWFDKQEHSLNFYRNKERDFWFADGDNGELFWSSEWRFIQFACASAGIRSKNYRNFSTETHLKIMLDDNHRVIIDKDFTPAVPPAIVTKYDGAYNDGLAWWDQGKSWGNDYWNSGGGNKYYQERDKKIESKKKDNKKGKALGNNVTFADNFFKSSGSTKRHGDKILVEITASKNMANQKKQQLLGHHAWEFDGSVPTKDDFKVIIPQIPTELVNAVMKEDFLIEGSIQSVSAADNVFLSNKKLRIINHLGDQWDSIHEKFIAKLSRMNNFHQYFEGEKPKVIHLPVHKVAANELCSFCGTKILSTDSHFAKVRGAGVSPTLLHNNCLNDYVKATSTTTRHYVKVKEGDKYAS